MRRSETKQMNDGAMTDPNESAARLSRGKSKIKNQKRESPFQRYMKTNYREHFRRVVAWRRAARWALFTYPLASGITFALPFVALHIVAKRLYKAQPEWFTNVLSADTETFVLSTLMVFTGVAIFLGLLTGIALGISRSRMLNFEAERTELNVRQSYFLRRISRGRRSSHHS